MDIKIIHEDDNFIAIDKPSGVVVNKSETAKEETVQDWAQQYLKIRNPKSEIRNKFQIPNSKTKNSFELRDSSFEFLDRSGVVHRLDKETSGILLIAKNPEAFLNLKNQFKDRTTEKTYIALSHEEIKPEQGEINVPVGRLPYNRTKFGVIAGGREALTRYKVLSIKYLVSKGNSEPLSLIELKPKTGRTHQIRVHLKYINHPIFSDPLYVGRKTLRNDRKFLDRLFLHAKELSFNHPQTGERMNLSAELPFDLTNFLNTLNS
jgi:23S rRNA pseudouridine1911/1915/1917 synthase